MQRSRLKNIINKSRELSNPESSYDLFVNSLPSELDQYKDGGKYRLKAAWKAYGEPKNYQEALWNGLVEIIGDKFSMPSIGYNEESDSYEYLNTGRENETVAKDIRVWDNDIIPFVKELKQGGYVRTFDEEQNCWKYSKNQQKEKEKFRAEEISSFKSGGAPKREKRFKTYEEFKAYTGSSENDYDLKGAYNDDEVYFKWEDEDAKTPKKAHLSDKYKLPNHPTFSRDSKYSNDYTLGGVWSKDEKGKWTFTTSPYVESQHSLEELLNYFKEYEPEANLIYKGYLYPNQVEAFKSGGQMNIIPEGVLHARRNNMELAEEGEVTSKGIPVVDMQGEQQAEVEKEEWTMTKELTEDVERWYKKFYDEETSNKEKDELAIKCGKRLVNELLRNTEDRAGLIDKIANEL